MRTISSGWPIVRETVKDTARAPLGKFARLVGRRGASANQLTALAEAMRAVRDAPHAAPATELVAEGDTAELTCAFNDMIAALGVRHQALERDLADRDAELERAQAAAAEARRAVGELLVGLRRELNAPLNGVAAMAGLLTAADLPARPRRHAELIAGAGASLISLVDDLLGGDAAPELDPRPTDPAEAIEDVLALLWDRAKAKGLDLAAFVDPAVPEKIDADPARLRQAVGALVVNALERTSAGAVIVQAAPKDGMLTISVRDTGEPLARGVASLGLAQCRRFAEAMGGALSAGRGSDKGAILTLCLPMTI